jgi:hypothetical protein
VFIEHNATNPARSSDLEVAAAACSSDTTSPTPRDLRAATARRLRVLRGTTPPSPAHLRDRNGTEAPCPSDTTSTLHRDPSGHNRMDNNVSIRNRRCRSGAPLRAQQNDGFGSDWSPPGVVPGRSAEHDGPGLPCPPGIPSRGKRVHQGATVLYPRTLAGATFEVWRVRRAHGTQHRAVHRALGPIWSDMFVRA